MNLVHISSSRLTDAGQQPPHYLPVRIATGRDSLHRLLSEGLSLLFGLSLVLRKRHPFADNFSACLMFRLHVKILWSKRWSMHLNSQQPMPNARPPQCPSSSGSGKRTRNNHWRCRCILSKRARCRDARLSDRSQTSHDEARGLVLRDDRERLLTPVKCCRSFAASALNFSTRHCALRSTPHLTRYWQAAACPRAAQKSATYRRLRFLQWQPWCRRQAQ
jgi:hypothetical protein